MQADIGSPDKYIETNDLKEVTNGNADVKNIYFLHLRKFVSDSHP